ncbi:carbohydrate ABC transporter permease [Desertihabitans aurantiacus]|uniref:carbohydrate ABC transporter permease n=1 Tax=Desertihabitans aurantiacus TaxID=2282477 RepID=UPI000DF737A6|nr:carbohydrate ABC transporter permease [Desertihabitans aurantiacus]
MSAPVAAAAPARGPGWRGAVRGGWPTRLVLLSATLLVLVPFAWMVSISFTPEEQAFSSVSLLPAQPTALNYGHAVTDANLGRAMLNSLVVTVVPVLTNCLAAVAAGYAFALLPFRGSTALFYLLLSTAAIPGSVTLIPLFLMAKGFPLAGGNDLAGYGGTGLLDSLPGLMLPHLVMTMNIFLARQYFTTANPDLAEAARVDGAGELRIFTAIYLPLSRPIVAVIAIFTFTGVWDDFLWPLVITQSPQVQTVQLALAQFLATGTVRYGTLMAGAVLATVPVLVIFLLNQRHFVSGLADGSVKG